METVNQVADWVHGDLWPDLTILLDAPVEVGMARAGNRSKPDRIENEESEFFARVRESYLELAANEPERFVVIDTTRALPEVQADVVSLAQDMINNINNHL